MQEQRPLQQQPRAAVCNAAAEQQLWLLVTWQKLQELYALNALEEQQD